MKAKCSKTADMSGLTLTEAEVLPAWDNLHWGGAPWLEESLEHHKPVVQQTQNHHSLASDSCAPGPYCSQQSTHIFTHNSN